MTFGQLVSEIEACTGIKMRSYRRITMGWEYVVLDVNGEYIFRIPRQPNHWKLLQREIALVGALRGQLSAPLPLYKFVWRAGSGHPEPFAGYRKLPGLPCTMSRFRATWIGSLGEDLGRFLTELHGSRLPPRTLRDLERHTPKTWAAKLRRMRAQVRRHAYPLLGRADRRASEAVWAELVSVLDGADFRPSLTHGDLTGGNIICDPSRGRLTGVVDWSDALVTDPAFDFAGILSIHRRLGEDALNHYGLDTAGLAERAELYLRVMPMREIAWGARQGSGRITRIGLNDFRRWSLAARS